QARRRADQNNDRIRNRQRASRAVSSFDAGSSGYMSAQRRVPMPTRRKFGSTRFVPAGIPGILVGRTSSPEQANSRRRGASIWYGGEPALRRVGTDHTPFSFDPETHATARIRPFRSNLCGHLQLVEPEFDSSQPPSAS